MLMLTLDSDFVASLSEEVVALSLAGGEHSVMFSRRTRFYCWIFIDLCFDLYNTA